MNSMQRLTRIASFVLAGAGVLLFVLNFLLDGYFAVLALPLVILMFGAAFFLLGFLAAQRWAWGAVVFLPAGLLVALGLILFLTAVTGDVKAWAYAWLLLLAGIGLGGAVAAWYRQWRQEFLLGSAGLVFFSLTLFVLFGAIAGGPVIQLMAPVLLVLGGLLLRRVRWDKVLPERLLARLPFLEPAHELAPQVENPSPAPALPADPPLVEPLSARELDVLRLIEQGLSNQEIAENLIVAQSTVKTHINNIYGKLSVENRVQALKRARELHLL